MFLDASAIVAIIAREPGYKPLLDRLEQAGQAISSPIAVWEAAIALQRADLLGSDRALPISNDLANAYTTAGAIYVAGDVAAGRDLLAMNFLLDRDADIWARELAELKEQVGDCDTSAPPTATGALSGTFTWRCERGRVKGSLLLAPTLPPRIQELLLAAIVP